MTDDEFNSKFDKLSKEVASLKSAYSASDTVNIVLLAIILMLGLAIFSGLFSLYDKLNLILRQLP